VLGYVTDRLGRRPIFTIDLSVFLTCSILMFFVTSNWQVLTLGLIMGLAIGADYSIGSPLLSEFTPSRRRGHFLGVLEIGWNVGYVVAFLVGYVINTHFPGAWHVTLAASAVPAVICLVIRHGLPESPRWLYSKGRGEEAEAILRDDVGVDRLGDFAREEKEETRWRVLVSPDYLLRTVFACTFWICIVLPYFALTFFQAEVLGDIGLGDNALAGALLGTVVALIGAVVGWRIVDRVGRRKILIGQPGRRGDRNLRSAVGPRPLGPPATDDHHGRRVGDRRSDVVAMGAGDQRSGAVGDRTPRQHRLSSHVGAGRGSRGVIRLRTCSRP
jgi:MFS transporter, putative metabolite transport protein